jgi:ABC-type glycerol-3-phosphate transport system substrate-binding protein
MLFSKTLFSKTAPSLQKTLTVFLIVLMGLGFMPSGTRVVAQGSDMVLTLRMPQFMRDHMDRTLIDEFEAANPGVQVVVSDDPDTFPMPLSVDVEQHLDDVQDYVSSADVVMVTPQFLDEIVTRAGYFLNLAPLTNTDTALDVEDFFGPVWQSYQWDAGVWAIPVATDAVVFIYDAAAFDAAGVAYPSANWTIDDLANAAELLTQRDSAGQVVVPGMSAFFENNLALLIRVLYGDNVVDESILPNGPAYNDPALEAILSRWVEMEQAGIVINGFHDQYNQIPLRMGTPSSINATFGGGSGGGGGGGSSSGSSSGQGNPSRTIGLLPNGTAGLNVQGFAVSSGTQYPEAAYRLASFLSHRGDIANNFQTVSAARRSVVNALATGDAVSFQLPYTPEQKAVIEAALENGIPVGDRRFTLGLETAVATMKSDGVDAQTALQTVEIDVLVDLALADGRNESDGVVVFAPDLPPELGPDEIRIHFGLGESSMMSSADPYAGWDAFFADFAANDAQVGYVDAEEIRTNPSIAELSETYDCFILPYNAVQSGDLSGLLTIDPLMDSDASMVRSDFIASVLDQVMVDSRIWALPLSIQPAVLRYDPDLLASAGIPLPEDGWTIGEFVDALHQLKTSLGDEYAPFVPLDIQGSYMMMLINGFGGVPIDYRTTPPTINFTDATTLDAIRQALDLAKDGYIEYQALAASTSYFGTDGERQIPLMHDNLSPNSPSLNYSSGLTGIMLYPFGTMYRGMSYNLRTAYISENAPNPEACYRLIAAAAARPELQLGMPARLTVVTDPAFVAAQGDDLFELYGQFEAALSDPNTIVLPSVQGSGIGGNRYFTLYWLYRAADRYVLDDADLAAELGEAELLTNAFLDCAADVESRREALGNQAYYEELNACAMAVDPTFRT